MEYAAELEQSLRYLKSVAALQAIRQDPYWPKWDHPWWHMLLLHEMGLTREIPASLMTAYVEAMNGIPLKIFPIQPGDLPEGVDPQRGTPCHCQLGNAYQVLAAYGVDVDRELPWIRPWLLRYQMADGGLSCDNDAYLVVDEAPSSMVGTISAFEAVLFHTPRAWTEEERRFLQKGAEFLMARKLMLGSTTKHNADEREDEADWLQLCFPRFYFYDVLRGLRALMAWSEKTGTAIPREVIAPVVEHMRRQFPDRSVRIGRVAYAGIGTIFPSPIGNWARQPSAPRFPLLEKVSQVGAVSPLLTQHWFEINANSAIR